MGASLALLFTSSCTTFDPKPVGGRGANTTTDPGGDVELFSWWTSGGEQEALEALFQVHQSEIPNAEVTNAAVEFSDKAREQLALRLSTGNPPDLYQANMGEDLLSWVVTNGRNDRASVVEGLNDLALANGWNDVFDPDVLASLTFDETLYGVPANIHRINALYYRKDLFEEFDLEVPESLTALLELCERISSNEEIQAVSPDGRMACLGLVNKWNWTLSLLTFEMIFPAVAGPEYYETYFLGHEQALSPELLATLDVALTLFCGGHNSDCLEHTWFNPDVNERTWDEESERSQSGRR